ncbi:MAG: 4-phosphoerythronate dehydrogenase, partial [Muribaculaceae bacterium]|nr:4-phosphoerythronate dehydrogenase [Muribaculaceae bacterium]
MKIIADSYIPFLKGRLEPFCDIEYLHPDLITAEAVKDADGLLIRTRTRCGKPLLGESKVQFIASGTIGMDQFDLPWCASRG